MKKQEIKINIPVPENMELVGYTTDSRDGFILIEPRYQPKYLPKDGDFIYLDGTQEHIYIVSKVTEDYICCVAELLNGNYYAGSRYIYDYNQYKIRLASEAEREALLEKLHKSGYDWDAEKKEVVDYKWRPKDGGQLYYPAWDTTELKFVVAYIIYYSNIEDHFSFQDTLIDKEMANRTRKEAQELCNRLNEAIKNIK